MSGQIDIICESFRTISKSIHGGSSVSTLGMLIERHNRIILFSEQIGKLFSFITLMQVAANTLVICCIGFLITIVSITEDYAIIDIAIYLSLFSSISAIYLSFFS